MADNNGNNVQRVNSFQFRDGMKTVPNWDKLPPVMVKRYLEWIRKSDTRWSDEYRVKVGFIKDSRFMIKNYLFEERADAVLCMQWWLELGWQAEIKML